MGFPHESSQVRRRMIRWPARGTWNGRWEVKLNGDFDSKGDIPIRNNRWFRRAAPRPTLWGVLNINDETNSGGDASPNIILLQSNPSLPQIKQQQKRQS